MVEPVTEPSPNGCDERDVAAVGVEPAVDDVGQLQLWDRFAGQAVEGHQCHGQCDSRIRRVQLGPDQGWVQRQLVGL